MSLHEIVKALGGELYDGGRRANIPHPDHSARDRSVSLWLHEGNLFIHTFGRRGDWRKVRDLLRAKTLLRDDWVSDTRGDGTTAPRPVDPKRRAVAQDLWAQGVAVERSLSARHLRLRHIPGSPPGPEVLRHHPSAPVSVYRPDPQAPRNGVPALMAAIRDADGQLTAIEITYLAADGLRNGRLKLPRKTVGLLPPGFAVRLDAAAPAMLVAEGIFTTLSARARFGLPAWALLSAGNLRTWRPPQGVTQVLIAADRGEEGEASAKVLADALRALDIQVEVRPPPPPFGDWNDAANEQNVAMPAGFAEGAVAGFQRERPSALARRASGTKGRRKDGVGCAERWDEPGRRWRSDHDRSIQPDRPRPRSSRDRDVNPRRQSSDPGSSRRPRARS